MSGEFEQVFQRMADRGKLRHIGEVEPVHSYLETLKPIRKKFGQEWFTTRQYADIHGCSIERALVQLNRRAAKGFVEVKRATSANAGKPNRWRLTPKG